MIEILHDKTNNLTGNRNVEILSQREDEQCNFQILSEISMKITLKYFAQICSNSAFADHERLGNFNVV